MEVESEPGTGVLGLDAELGNRISQVAAMVGSDREAARIAGISVDTLSNYEQLRTGPKLEPLLRLARAAEVSIAWMITGEGEARSPARPTGAPPAPGDLVALPQYNLEAGAGAGGLIEPEHVVDFVHFRREWLRQTLGVNPAKLAMLTATGDSMADTISDGDLMIIDGSDPRFRGDGVYVLAVDEALMVKRVGLRLAGGLRISSDNPKYPEVLDVAARDVEGRVRIAGKVMWVGGLL